MLSAPGDYYVRVKGYNGFEEDATLTCSLLPPDEWEGEENNNTWQNATAINEGVATIFTMPAYNDVDWYKFTATEDNMTVEVEITVPDGGSVSDGHVYSGAGLNAYGESDSAHVGYVDWGSGSGRYVNRCMLGEAGTYYIRVTPYGENYVFDRDGTLTIRLIGPDSNEHNNTWQTATAVPLQTNVQFTLPAYNDFDYFYIGRVEAGDKYTITIDGLPRSQNGSLSLL